MQTTPQFAIRAMWQGRQESAPAIAERLRAFLTLSQAPPDRSWHYILPNHCCDLQANPGQIDQYVDQQIMEEREGEWASLPGNGCRGVLSALCDDRVPRADDPHFEWRIGGLRQNHVDLYTDNEGSTDPRFVAYDVMRTNVLAVATAFSPDWCKAGPTELFRFLDLEPYVRPPITLAWMVWLSPAYARLVEPPHISWQTIVEPFNDGGLFMATGTNTFDVNHSLDLAKARSIHRQIDPLNYTVPFNGKWGRSDRVPPFPKV